MSIVDRDTSSGSIADTDSATLEIDAKTSDGVYLTIDDGTTDNNPAEYTITVRGFNPDLERYQFVWDETTRTDRSWNFGAVGSQTQVEITNTSGGSANYDIMLEGRND